MMMMIEKRNSERPFDHVLTLGIMGKRSPNSERIWDCFHFLSLPTVTGATEHTLQMEIPLDGTKILKRNERK